MDTDGDAELALQLHLAEVKVREKQEAKEFRRLHVRILASVSCG